MNKKIIVIILGVTAVLVTAILAGYLQYRNSLKVTSPVAKVQPTPVVIEELTTWTDPANFSFQYPRSLSLNPHNEDQLNYAHVELTSATHSGSLIVWVKDTTANTIDNWMTQSKITNAIDSNLGGTPAKKVLTTGDASKLTLSTIQDGYLYQVETSLADLPVGEAGKDFWNKTMDTVTSSFKFTPADKGSTNQTPDTGSNGEEVIE